MQTRVVGSQERRRPLWLCDGTHWRRVKAPVKTLWAVRGSGVGGCSDLGAPICAVGAGKTTTPPEGPCDRGCRPPAGGSTPARHHCSPWARCRQRRGRPGWMCKAAGVRSRPTARTRGLTCGHRPAATRGATSGCTAPRALRPLWRRRSLTWSASAGRQSTAAAAAAAATRGGGGAALRTRAKDAGGLRMRNALT